MLLNMSHKKSKKYSLFPDNDMNIKIERKAYARRFAYLKDKGYRFIYLDECSLNENYKPEYGYSLRGKPLRLK